MSSTIWSGARRFAAGAAAIAAALSLGAAARAREEPVRGGTLTAIVYPEPPILTTAINAAAPTGVVSTNIFDGLVRYDFGMEPKPALAESWEVSEDGKTIRFNLRKGVKWHDGKPFTSADVKFSLLEVWKKIHPRGKATFANVVDVQTPDAHTVILKLSAPSPVIFNALNAYESQILPKHLYEGTDLATNPYNVEPIGTGPFRFKEWRKGSYIILERNEDYWDEGKPHLDRIVFRIIPDASARAAALETGEAQYAPYNPVPLADVGRLRALPHLTVETRGYEFVASWFFLEFNLRDPILDDVRVRRAIAHAIDRRVVAETVFYGFGKPATGPVPSTVTRYYTDDVPRYPFDPKRAEALLDEAGYPRGPGGVRFALTHDFLPYGNDYRRAAEYVKQALRKVGIDVTVRAQDVPTFLRRVYTDYDFDISSTWLSTFSDPQIGQQRIYWSRAINKGTPWTNASGYSNPEMDEIIVAAQREVDPKRRVELFHRMQALAMRDLPSLPLIEMKFFTVHSKKVKGVPVVPDGVYASLREVWLEP